MFHSSSSWRLRAIGITAACLIMLTTSWYRDSEIVCHAANGSQFCTDRRQQFHSGSTNHSDSFKHRNIAIATCFVLHFDVWLPVAWTLQRVMQGIENSKVQAYAQTPFAHDFGAISDQLGLYQGSVKDYQAIIADLRANEGDGGIDMVILATAVFECVSSVWFCSEL